MLRRIFGRTKNGTWIIKSNAINNVIKNRINYIKAQTLSWFGHIHRMTNDTMVKKTMNGNRYLQD